jgi:hypothetical protein
MKKVKINMEYELDIKDSQVSDFLEMEGCDDFDELKTCIKCSCKKDPIEFIEYWEILTLSQVIVEVVTADDREAE